jgi:hypothetical protein
MASHQDKSTQTCPSLIHRGTCDDIILEEKYCSVCSEKLFALQSQESDDFILWEKSKNERKNNRTTKYHDRYTKVNYVARQLSKLRKQERNLRPSVLQSAEMTDTENTIEDVVQAENIMFRDGALSERVTMGDMTSGGYDQDADSTAALGEFLSRPVKIYSLTWPESTFTQTSIKPWQLYFNTLQIRNKLTNYSRIQCKLHLKFIVNASPFYYGSLRACYFPLTDPRSTYSAANDQIPFSQVPGVYLEPQNMTTAEMVLPFLWPRNWLDATTLSDFTNMGTLNFLQYANLRSANGVTGSGITVAVYAWAEEVQLMGPSYQAALQSDEYDDTRGTISGPATAVASFADQVTSVPVVGDFARATAIGARAVAGIAKLFGYSNPPMIDDVMPVQAKTFHAFANTETRMPIDKLSVDPKNEVTISSSVTGVDEPDPLAFSNLLSRESFLQGALWANSSPPDTLLWSTLVAPGYQVTNTYSTYPPVAYFGSMFRFWRGSLIYKFRFIKTRYHTGRVFISWDPAGDITATPDTETVTFTRVVDLQVEDEVEIIVPYKATAPYLDTGMHSSFSNGATPSYTYSANAFNGSLVVRVQNILTGPAVSPQIDILVYVRAGDDFMYAVPQNITTGLTPRDPTGVLQSQESDDIDMQTHSVDETVSAITTGELICSLRPLLHRTSLAYTQFAGENVSTVAAGLQHTLNWIWRVPYGLGRMNTGYSMAVPATPYAYNFAPNHPIDWVLNAFVGYRGSTNIAINVSGIGDNARMVTALSMERFYGNPIFQSGHPVRNAATNTTSFLAPGTLARDVVDKAYHAYGQPGMTLTNVQGQPALMASVPQYLKARFLTAFTSVRNIDPKTNTRFYDEVAVRCEFATSSTSSATANWPVLSYYYSAGVDFQPIFFLCTPRLFASAIPTAADTIP